MRRFAAIAVLAAAALAPAASASAPRFTLPPKAAQGQLLTIRAAVKSGTRCFLVVRFADNASEAPGPLYAKHGVVQWRWRVAPTAALGEARATIACGRAGSSTQTFTVTGPLVQPKVVVQKQGFSQRNSRFGDGSNVSYGIVLSNPSPQQDALNTFVLVNFVDAANHALGTATTTVDFIGAGSTYNLGASMGLRTQVPVARLEITIRTQGSQPHRSQPSPALQNVAIFPGGFEPGFMGEVDGELVNGSATMMLSAANFSIVVLDASGQVVGGGTGMLLTTVPSGARCVWTAQSGFDSIPLTRAATPLISIRASYRAAG